MNEIREQIDSRQSAVGWRAGRSTQRSKIQIQYRTKRVHCSGGIVIFSV